MRPVEPDVVPRPVRFQCRPTLAPGAVAGRTGGAHAEGRRRSPSGPFREIALSSLVAGGDAAPNGCLHGCATAAIVSATARTKPTRLLTPEPVHLRAPSSEIRSDGLAGRCARRVEPRGPAERLPLPHLQQKASSARSRYPKTGRCRLPILRLAAGPAGPDRRAPWLPLEPGGGWLLVAAMSLGPCRASVGGSCAGYCPRRRCRP